MKRLSLPRFALCACLAAFAINTAMAQPPGGPPQPPQGGPGQKGIQAPQGLDPELNFAKPGPMVGNLGNATIKVPPGYLFVDKAGMPKFYQLTNNPFNPTAVGAIINPQDDWFVVFSFDASGYIKDDEKGKVGDAAAILKERQEMQEEGNKVRKAQNKNELEITGWALAPYYDNDLKSLASAVKLRSKGTADVETVNFKSHILGRKGHMDAILVCSVPIFDKVLPQYKTFIKDFNFIDGEKYSDFKAGDKVAEYGLYALAATGGVAVLAKAGILGKLLKPLLLVGALVIAGFAKFFGSIFGKKKQEA